MTPRVDPTPDSETDARDDRAKRPFSPPPAPTAARWRFERGRKSPRGVAWFGVRSFWGHLRHFVASGIATEDIDSRDWMTPDEPTALVRRVSRLLGGSPDAVSVVEALGRDVFVDYVADTGDDVSVSEAVARLVFADYELPDLDRPGETLVAPRGDLLVFGGDTAYPVATAQEITNRVVVPFNQVLAERDDGRERVLLGIAGNHDWYDGLDGFSRLFRRRDPAEEQPRPSMVGISQRMLEHYTRWARELVKGGTVEKPDALALEGYTPVQNASYFVLPLTDTIHLFGVDRQLKELDRRQVAFHTSWYHRHPEAHPWVLLPDPVYAFGRPSPTGTDMVRSLSLDLHDRPTFILSGDIHHYERLSEGSTLHVTAGGGGAFLHPAGAPGGAVAPEVSWPNAEQTRALLRQVPLKIALGRSGFLPHLALAALFAPAMALGAFARAKLGIGLVGPVAAVLAISVILALIGGARKQLRRTLPLASAAALLTIALPVATGRATRWALALVGIELPPLARVLVMLTIAIFAGTWLFGAYLALLTRLGIEQTQAFTALDHPGFKHFVRLRVRADGTGVDGWCVGLTNPVAESEQPVLVDTFRWRPE